MGRVLESGTEMPVVREVTEGSAQTHLLALCHDHESLALSAPWLGPAAAAVGLGAG